MANPELDQARIEAFSGQILITMNAAALGTMFSIGHRTELFDWLATLPPATSAEIADAAALNERYVREWLGAMVCGHIVTYNPATRQYHLPPEHAALLTRAAGPGNLAAFFEGFSMLSVVEDAVVDCFRHGGGVPYTAFPKFQQVMAATSGQIHDATLLQATLPLVDGLIGRLEDGLDVADVCCGQGHAANLIAKAFPKSRVTGYDFSSEGLAAGAAEAERLGLRNVRFQVQDAALLDVCECFDLITVFDAIHDQAKPRTVLRNLYRALRPGGTFLMVDIAASSQLEENLEHPLGPGFYTISTVHCMTVSLAQGGEGLGTMWGEQTALELLAGAGFTDVEVKRVGGDMLNSYYIATKSIS